MHPQPGPPVPTAAAPASSLGWRESWPAKLFADQVSKLREELESPYPTELLDADKIQSAKEVRWIFWKFR